MTTESAQRQDARLTLTDIAHLAKVQRPVVSMWRTRSTASTLPFPRPCGTLAGRELFDLDEIVEWLARSGRGNNPRAHQDGVAFTLSSHQATTDPDVFAGLTALVCLWTLAGPLPQDSDDLLDLAEEHDPDNAYLASELEALGERLVPLARYAGSLGGVASDAADSFEQLLEQRARHRHRHARTVSAQIQDLVVATATGLADQAGIGSPTFVLVNAADVDLIIGPSDRLDTLDAMTVALPAGDDPDLRLARRRLLSHRIGWTTANDADGDYDLPVDSIVLLRLRPDLSPASAIGEVSRLSLAMTDRTRALVLGPAAWLTDALPVLGRGPGRPAGEDVTVSQAAQSRRDVIKTRLLRAAVRLPRGALTDQPRARAALWCLGPRPDERYDHTLCADVDHELTPARADDLVTDLVASMAGPRSQRGHVMRFGRFVRTSDLQVATGSLIPAVVPGAASVSAATVSQDLHALADRIDADLPRIGLPQVAATSQQGRPDVVPLSGVIRSGAVQWIAGSRLERQDLRSGDGIRVVFTPADLIRADPITIDPLLDARRYPHSSRTLPGDLVVSTSPRPAAEVDHDGGSLVGYPARILRCRPRTRPPQQARQALVPHAVAMDINALPDGHKDWRSWPIRRVPLDQLDELGRLLTEVSRHRRAVEQHLDDLDRFTETLLTGLSTRTLTLSPTEGP